MYGLNLNQWKRIWCLFSGKNTNPIASVFLKDVNFRVDYPRLYDMEYDEITKIFDSLEAYVQTDLLAREINFFRGLNSI